MAEEPELVREVMVDADDLLANIVRNVSAPDELVSGSGSREDAGLQQGLGVRVQQRTGDRVVVELNQLGGIRLKHTLRVRGATTERQSRPRELRGNGRGNLARIGCVDGRRDGAAVLAGQRDSLLDTARLEHLAPLHVVKEERLVPILVVHLGDEHRAADVEAKVIQPIEGNRQARRVPEGVLGVQILVAHELPGFGMEVPDSGLDHQGHGAGGGQAVFRAVVRGELAEFGNRFYRGHDDECARAAAVEVFPTIHHPEVVGVAQTVETDGGVGAHRRRDLVVHHVAGGAGQSRQRIDASTVTGDLGDLISRDHVADFAALGLNSNGGRFDGHALRSTAEFQLEIQAGAIALGQDQVFALSGLETSHFGADRIVPDLKVRGQVLALGVGGDLANLTGVGVRDLDGRICDGCSGRVRYSSDKGCFLRERLESTHSKEDAHQKYDSETNLFHNYLRLDISAQDIEPTTRADRGEFYTG